MKHTYTYIINLKDSPFFFLFKEFSLAHSVGLFTILILLILRLRGTLDPRQCKSGLTFIETFFLNSASTNFLNNDLEKKINILNIYS